MICPSIEAGFSKIVGTGHLSNPATKTSYRIFKCSDKINKDLNKTVSCADEVTLEIKYA